MNSDFVVVRTEKSANFTKIIDEELNHKQNIDISKQDKPLLHKVVDICTKQFTDGEMFPRIEESVGNYNVTLVHQIKPTLEELAVDFMYLLQIEDALKRTSINKFDIVLPYFPFARMDRKEDGRVPISAKLAMDLISTAGGKYLNRISIFDLHASQEQAFYDGPLDNMYARPLFEWYISNKLFKNVFDANEQKDIFVSGALDTGSLKFSRQVAKNLGIGLAISDKERKGSVIDGINPEVNEVYGDVKGKIVLACDDIGGTLGSLEASLKMYMENGAKDVYFFCTHGVFNYSKDENGEKLDVPSRIKSMGMQGKIFMTDTIPRTQQEINDLTATELSVAPIAAEAIYRRARHGMSVSELAKSNNSILNRIFDRTIGSGLYVRKYQ